MTSATIDRLNLDELEQLARDVLIAVLPNPRVDARPSMIAGFAYEVAFQMLKARDRYRDIAKEFPESPENVELGGEA